MGGVRVFCMCAYVFGTPSLLQAAFFPCVVIMVVVMVVKMLMMFQQAEFVSEMHQGCWCIATPGEGAL